MVDAMPRVPEPEPMDIAEEAQVYAQADFAEVNAGFVARLLELVGPQEAGLALDLGTGPGDIPRRVIRERPAWRIVAADVSLPMLGYVHRAVEPDGAIHALCMDAKTAPFPPGVFDIIFSNSILHHVSDTDRFWAEVRRVAKPHALVFLRDLARPASRAAAADIVAQYAGTETGLLREEFYRSLLSAYTPDEVRGQLARSGLAQLRVAMSSDRHLDICGTIA